MINLYLELIFFKVYKVSLMQYTWHIDMQRCLTILIEI